MSDRAMPLAAARSPGVAAGPLDPGSQARLLAILDLARWAPSGDNTQPWRFEIAGERHLVVHGHDTRDWCVYDLQGRASQLSIGALLESARIAATGQGLATSISRRAGSADAAPVYDLRFAEQPGTEPDPLLPCLRSRSVQRRPLSARPLASADRSGLEGILAPGYAVRWIDSPASKRAMARLLFSSAWIRLTSREAFEVHRRVIEWGATHSADRLPERAIGVDPMTGRLMRWAMQDWARVRFMNRFLAGTWLPRMQLDVAPALACAAHFVLLADRPPESVDDHVEAGMQMQRFWLEAERRGIRLQPETTPLIFADYVRRGVRFSSSEPALRRARDVAAGLERIVGADAAGRAFFCGRVGYGPAAASRSTRLEVESLLIDPPPSDPRPD